ncbi:hypothetical protein BU813_19445 [Klebsiella pneumoniae subsp. pneumoniae]|uniref:Uncharacterized protein n=5 Tax=Klebsiella pneumoniae complex TaxID=3390273 RepID=A0A0H3GS60_KLEPH|nr:hypothetical protein [Klebsiella pneumoniae]YP_005226493.1 hypothetical protein KPHS_21930 [Klebsiella pneumoniae subsp. pneumoniae HS11286]ACI11248.1 hypothetical protein KPK_3149 [Klebsiella variicola]AFQ66188.1 hypothetical protein A79E_2896 [Klebsiella pneumoniae subsp. pneumoniae 1084]AGT24654.1 hypothetical protein N559_2991 [Klebsiella pneumoniae JM45]AIK79789.1 hypothetical protein VK055_1166 [Klebsiella pneumoniae subsp. pneumoniae]AJB32868.1 hypothetical protein P244_2951 [Klebsi
MGFPCSVCGEPPFRGSFMQNYPGVTRKQEKILIRANK